MPHDFVCHEQRKRPAVSETVPCHYRKTQADGGTLRRSRVRHVPLRRGGQEHCVNVRLRGVIHSVGQSRSPQGACPERQAPSLEHDHRRGPGRERTGRTSDLAKGSAPAPPYVQARTRRAFSVRLTQDPADPQWSSGHVAAHTCRQGCTPVCPLLSCQTVQGLLLPSHIPVLRTRTRVALRPVTVPLAM